MNPVPDSQQQTPNFLGHAQARLALLRRLDAADPRSIVALALALLALIGLLDYVFGTEISLTLFYLLPISLLAWYLGWRWGAAGGLIAALIWLVVNIASGLRFSQPAIYVWNSLMRLGTFEVVAYLLAELRLLLQHEQQLARVDYVTGALNARAFYDALQNEIARAARYGRPLTVAYVDLDNFKSVNDRLGHRAGDEVLLAVVNAARSVLRASDLVGRLGGDEFVLLLPETGSDEARAALDKVHRRLLESMDANSWPVTFSIGSLTNSGLVPDSSADDLVHAADSLMYAVKRGGKNGVQFGEFLPHPP